MKPISAEDNFGDVLAGISAKNKSIGIAILLVVVLISIFNSLVHTGFVITDSDPSGYSIVVMLMLLVMVLFSAKEDVKMAASNLNIAIGLVIAAVFVLFTSVLRGYLSFSFYTVRADALLFPLIMLSLIITLFGMDGLKKLKWLVVYSAFASPALLYWLIGFNGTFVNLNASAVYSILSAMGLPLTKIGITIAASAASPSISIASTCAALGIFISLFMFLAPVAYLYKGKTSRKVAWLATAVVLLLLLNLIRMVSISLIWVYSGTSSALSTYHAFAGEILFYIAIIVMLLVSGRYGLTIPRLDAQKLRKSLKNLERQLPYANVVAAAIFAILFFAVTMPYTSVSSSSLASFNLKSQVNRTQLFNMEVNQLSTGSNLTVYGLQLANNATLFRLNNNDPAANYSVYAVSGFQQKPFPVGIYVSNNDTFRFRTIILRNGITLNSGYLISNNTNFTVDYFSLPFVINGTTISVGYEFFQPQNSTAPLCSTDIGIVNALQSQIYSAFISGSPANQKVMCTAYRMATLG